MSTKSEVISVRLTPEQRERIQVIADVERRTKANVVSIAIEQYLRDKDTQSRRAKR